MASLTWLLPGGDEYSTLAKSSSSDMHLRIIAIAVLLVTSGFGALLPVVIKRYTDEDIDEDDEEASFFKRRFAPAFFDFAKYLGSGIIISTAFVHLLSPGFSALKDPRLPEKWLQYDWAPVITMTAVFAIFIVELLAFRLGTTVLKSLGMDYDAHGHAHSSHGPCEDDVDESHDDIPPHSAAHSSQRASFDSVDQPYRSSRPHDVLDNCDIESARVMTEEESLRVPILRTKIKPVSPATAKSVAASLRRPRASQLQIDHSRNVKSIYGSLSTGSASNLHDHAHPHGSSSDYHIQGSNSGQNGHGSESEYTSFGKQGQSKEKHSPAAQIIGVTILEFGVLLHSFVIGLTLAVVERFVTLFVVITLHQTFEGLGLGARLANLSLPYKMRWVPVLACVLYACITPLGLAIGLLVRKSYSADSPTSIVVSGILDSLSAGVLLYTGLVELLCAEFLFHQEMREAPLRRVLYALGCVILGAIIMAVLGIWA